MPRDVSTRWNSTYDMLAFAVKYRAAIDSMTAARDLGLRDYELVSAEWKIAEEVAEVLKVCHYLIIHSHTYMSQSRFLKMLRSFSPEELQTLHPSSQRWTTLTRPSRPPPIVHSNLPLPFKRLLQLARAL